MKDSLVCNYLRLTSVLQINKANSGHPGVCLGGAPIAFSIYKNAFVLPTDSNFINRDRIVFSAGHASALVYSVLNLFNFGISLDDLKNFRQFGSVTSGHPETKVADGVDVSTGPLGQGVANAVGFAIAEKYLHHTFKRNGFSPIDHYTYCFSGDGCLMEGVAQEAISLAGNLKLNKLILLYDCNNITIEGNLDIANSEKVKNKFLACNWNVLQVKDGNDVCKIDKAISKAKKSDKPTIIIVNTQIGYGSSMVNTAKVHGKPLDDKQIEVLRQNLGYFVPDWQIPMQAKVYVEELIDKKNKMYQSYQKKLQQYKEDHPKAYKTFKDYLKDTKIDLNTFAKGKYEKKKFDGRQQLHDILNLISVKVPNLIGGCADVAPSTRANIDASNYFSHKNPTGKNIAFGIREHAMGAICNGINLHGGLNAFCSTFFAFANYMTPAMRMSALMKAPVLYLFTHDSILVGEDGPTHQSIEQIATLRCMPDIYVCRPCGRQELLQSFNLYFSSKKPTAILIGRQPTDFIEDDFNGAQKGAYAVVDYKDFDATIMATGSEVSLAVNASKALLEMGYKVKVVSAPCLELFEEQPTAYKNKVVDRSKPFVCVEASSDNIWFKYATNEKAIIKLNSFGASGKAEEVYNHFGFSVKNLVKIVKNFLNKKV